jgi:hypothetical protein
LANSTCICNSAIVALSSFQAARTAVTAAQEACEGEHHDDLLDIP